MSGNLGTSEAGVARNPDCRSRKAVVQVAADLDISAQVIHTRRQHLIDTGQMLRITSRDQAELVATRRRIA
jgi:hypothetical protein